jgi:tetratricopeptide (TPR) repeat protein
VFAIQSDIAGKVTEALREHILAERPPVKASTTTRSTKSYVNYLRGRQLWNKRTEPDLLQAITFFQDALRSDPGYVKAYTGLADTYAVLALLEFMPPKEAFPEARAAVERALALDADLVDAHTSLGLIHFQYDWAWPEAEAEFRRAIEINPGYAPAHHFYADLLKARGRFAEATAQIEQAQELDPLSLAINTGVGHVYYLARQYDRAIEQYQRAVDLDPGFMATHLWFGRPFLEKGMYAEAISELETAVRLSGESTVALAMLGHGLASAGRTSEALNILEQLRQRAEVQYVPSYWIAVIYNGLRDRDQVMAWMRRAFEERSSWLVWSNVEPRFEWIRSDPEFAALMREMRLI